MLLQSADMTITNGTGTDLTVNGTWKRAGGIVNIDPNANIAVNSGGMYSHELSFASVPLASWATNSTCRIAVTGNSYPGDMDQMFGNVLFESSIIGTMSMTNDLTCTGNLTINNSSGALRLSSGMASRGINVGGNFLMQSGIFRAKGSGAGSAAIAVSGNFSQSGGTFALRSGTGGSSVMNVQGNFSQTGGTFNMTSVADPSTLNVQGDFSVTGGIFRESASGPGYGEVNFTKNGTQQFTSGGIIQNDIRFKVNALSTLHIPLGQTVGGDGSFTNNGTVTGRGTIAVNSTNNSNIIPGSSIGTLTINGSLSLNSSSEIIMEIQGGPPVSDLLDVSGALNLSGTLTVNLIGMGSIMPMDSFTLFKCGTCVGTFSTINLPGGPSLWSVHYGATNFRIQYIGMTPLPIELLYFDAKPEGRTVLITWGTATEYNNDYMAVERSANGRNWQEIGRVSGAGTTTTPQHYRLVDEKPLQGINYYRLKQVDFDGNFEYHKVVALSFEHTSHSSRETPPKVFPNPVLSQLTMVLDSSAPLDRMIWLYSLQGQLVHTWLLPAGMTQHNVNMAELPSGMYMLRVEGLGKAVLVKKE